MVQGRSRSPSPSPPGAGAAGAVRSSGHSRRTRYLKGAWSAVGAWPLIAVHMVLTPDGRVLSYGTDGNGTQTGYFIYDVWDSAAGLGGGHLDAAQRHRHRHLLQLAARAAAGRARCSSPAATTGPAPARPTPATTTATCSTTATNTLTPRQQHEPRALVLDVHHAAQRRGLHPGRHRAAPTGPRSAARTALSGCCPARTPAPSTSCTRATSSRPTAASSATTATAGCTTSTPSGSGSITQRRPVRRRPIAAATRARRCSAPGRILQFGGNSNGAIVIDINGASPTVTPTQSMSSQRRLVTATVLADGKVLATGGSQV